MPSLNILIYNKVIKQAAKPAVHVKNMSGLNMLQFDVNNSFVTYKTQLVNIGQSTQYRTYWAFIFFFLKGSENSCLVVF